jgi:hypothetical protein
MKFDGYASSGPKDITSVQARIVTAADCKYTLINNNTSKMCIIFLERILERKNA